MLNHFYDHASHGAVFFAALFPVMHHPTAHHARLFIAHDLAGDEFQSALDFGTWTLVSLKVVGELGKKHASRR